MYKSLENFKASGEFLDSRPPSETLEIYVPQGGRHEPEALELAGESGAHEAPYVTLLTRVSSQGVGESPGATDTAAPLETE